MTVVENFQVISVSILQCTFLCPSVDMYFDKTANVRANKVVVVVVVVVVVTSRKTFGI